MTLPDIPANGRDGCDTLQPIVHDLFDCLEPHLRRILQEPGLSIHHLAITLPSHPEPFLIKRGDLFLTQQPPKDQIP